MKKNSEPKLRKIKKEELPIVSPLMSMTPNSSLGFVPYNYDLGFSSLADSIKTQYRFVENPFKNDKTPSPSTLLYFNHE